MQKIIGRKAEIAVLREALMADEAELVVLFGRKRVGKTFLIRQVYEKNIVFEFTGMKEVSLSTQLENFAATLTTMFGLEIPLDQPTNWLQAFRTLIKLMEGQRSRKPKVIFLDEFPWMDTPKSEFLSAFDHFWNSWASRQRHLVVVICGSAAAWMIQNIINNKGGLHNRLTRRIRLKPFNLAETEQFLKSRRVTSNRYQILQLYMAMGGIPHYLKEIKPGESAAQAIDRICFSPDGLLREEFGNLYPALFDESGHHLVAIRALADKPTGLSRNQLMETCGLSSGGNISKMLDELLQSGFILAYLPFGKNTRETIYKLSDEFSAFYLKFIENSIASGSGAWLQKSSGAAWKTWSGQAFESICLKHVPQIKKSLGIAGIYVEESIWRYIPREAGEEGAQIDMILDRADNCINLIEIKFHKEMFSLERSDVERLERAGRIFTEKTGTKKNVFYTMLTTFGVKVNEHYLGLIQNQVVMNALYEEI
jgi:uncharacterized protein